MTSFWNSRHNEAKMINHNYFAPRKDLQAKGSSQRRRDQASRDQRLREPGEHHRLHGPLQDAAHG